MIHNKDCIFCKIIREEIPSKLIAENQKALAFMDIDPVSDGHILVIPKEHYQDFSSCDDEYLVSVMLLAKQIVKILNNSKLNPWGINYLSNEKDIAGQIVKHFHLHIIPKYAKNEGFILENAIDKSKRYLDDINLVFEKIAKSKYTIK